MIYTERPMCDLFVPQAKPLTEPTQSVPREATADTLGSRDELLAFLGHELRTPLSAALQGVKALWLAAKDPTMASQALELDD